MSVDHIVILILCVVIGIDTIIIRSRE